MARPTIRLLSTLLLSAAAGFWALQLVPSSPLDHAAVRLTAHALASPPFIVSGKGSHQEPWSLQAGAPEGKVIESKPPLVVSLGDDREGIFQSSPPSPIDLAVVLRNIRRLGSEEVAISAVMAWEKPDAIALTALDAELSKFRGLATAAPLSRSANASALPPSFRLASLPLDQVKGDASALPAVNRVSLPDVILGGLSGFSVLEQEKTGDAVPLVARWDDRAVLAFPIVAVMSKQGIPIDDIRIDLGNFLQLGASGPVIPIDEFGRMKAVSATTTGEPVPAATLIDRQEPLASEPEALVLLRDDQSAAETATLAYSKAIAPLIGDVLAGAGMSPLRHFRRLPLPFELAALGGVSLLLALFARARFPIALVVYGILTAIVLAAAFITADTYSIWLPTLPAVFAIVPAIITCGLLKDSTAAPVMAEESVPVEVPRGAAAAPAPEVKAEEPAPEAPKIEKTPPPEKEAEVSLPEAPPVVEIAAQEKEVDLPVPETPEPPQIIPPEEEPDVPAPEVTKVQKTILPEKKAEARAPEATKALKIVLPEKKTATPAAEVSKVEKITLPEKRVVPPGFIFIPAPVQPAAAPAPEKPASAPKETPADPKPPAKKAAKKSASKKAASKKSPGKKGTRKRSGPSAGS